jgi:hypothetical protein
MKSYLRKNESVNRDIQEKNVPCRTAITKALGLTGIWCVSALGNQGAWGRVNEGRMMETRSEYTCPPRL